MAERMARRAPDGAARAAARAVQDGFESWWDEFAEITRRAPRRFVERDWRAHHADALARLHLWAAHVTALVERLRGELGERAPDAALWAAAKTLYATSAGETTTAELRQTFFSSVTRRLLRVEGVSPATEFVAADAPLPPASVEPALLARYELDRGAAAALRRLLEEHGLGAPFEDLAGDAELGGARLTRELGPGELRCCAIEVLRSVFFRNKAAYVVGRVALEGGTLPLVLPLLHGERGLRLDALLTDEDEVSILFSFTRSHFHVETDRPGEVIAFLRTILPRKPVADLYIAVGFHKHGKTELYRDLLRQLEQTSAPFEHAPGDRGMVMIVFTLPGHDRVYKVIRDTFAYPKSTTPRDVMKRYRLVFERDRVGRLVEAQAFDELEFGRRRFAPALLAELLGEASRTVRLKDERVILDRVYIERRVRPLNLYLAEVGPGSARRAVVEYGRAIKDLAAANIFPGDFLLKNFGVTRHGRVVFYDYDELCLVTDCRFARLPQARTPEDELEPEPWFAVGDADVFPEEFRTFLDLPGPLLDVFERYHGELFTVEYWNELERRHRAGELPDFHPYPAARRLRRQRRQRPGAP